MSGADTLAQQAIRLKQWGHTALQLALGLDGLGRLELVTGNSLEQTRRLQQHAAENSLKHTQLQYVDTIRARLLGG